MDTADNINGLEQPFAAPIPLIDLLASGDWSKGGVAFDLLQLAPKELLVKCLPEICEILPKITYVPQRILVINLLGSLKEVGVDAIETLKKSLNAFAQAEVYAAVVALNKINHNWRQEIQIDAPVYQRLFSTEENICQPAILEISAEVGKKERILLGAIALFSILYALEIPGKTKDLLFQVINSTGDSGVKFINSAMKLVK